MEENPEDECWGAVIQFQTTNGKALRIRCSTASLRPFTPHNDAVVEVLLGGIAQELTELLNTLPQNCKGALDIHGCNSSPFVTDLQRGIAFQYHLRVFDHQKHQYCMTHDHWHDDRNTLQCIQGLRNACVQWIDSIQELSEQTRRAAG